ncbi:hypothetical protein A9Q81_16425 [Gammaproteobacteria bacterium 42_54_T18]|nr:hypothetical protein A9Q81_16425 [Gammaproteobacteria bacterium 42_54_T18]
MKLFQLKVVGLCFVLSSQFLGQVATASDAVVKDMAIDTVNGEIARPDKDVALSLLTQGLAHCTKATRSTRTNQLAAMQEYEMYVTALNRARAIYPNISEHSRTLSRQMQQCSQIGTDIARVQALPLLEKGVLACKEAKAFAKGDYLSKARVKYREYLDLRNQAVALTSSVLKVASNSSKVRRCDKLESSLMAAQTRVVNDEYKANELITLLQRAEDSCLVAQRLATKSGESRINLDTTKSMLVHAERYFSQTQLHKDALNRAANYPGYGSSKQIKQLTSTFSICRGELVAIIDAATKSVNRQEELSKIQEKQLIQKAVAIAVAEARKEVLASFRKQTQLVEKVVIDPIEPKPAGPNVAASESVKLSLPSVEGPIAGKVRDKSPVARARAGKLSRARTEVVQVTESW